MKTMANLDVNKYRKNDQDLINRKFLGACRRGDFETVKLLLTHVEIPFKPQLNIISENVFKAATNGNNLELFQYLEAVYKTNKIEIKMPLLGMACRYANHEMLGYISQYYDRASIDNAFNYLLVNDKVNAFIYMLEVTQREFSQEEMQVFFKKLVDKATGTSEEMLFWMLVEQNLFMNPELKQWLYDQPQKINSIKAISLLEKVELKEKMQKSFGDKATVETKSKI